MRRSHEPQHRSQQHAPTPIRSQIEPSRERPKHETDQHPARDPSRSDSANSPPREIDPVSTPRRASCHQVAAQHEENRDAQWCGGKPTMRPLRQEILVGSSLDSGAMSHHHKPRREQPQNQRSGSLGEIRGTVTGSMFRWRTCRLHPNCRLHESIDRSITNSINSDL